MPRSDTIESLQTYRKRLASKAARHAVTQLCGDDAATAKRLREFIASLPASWKSATAETLTETRRRRARLASHLRGASKELAQDPEYTHLTLLELRDRSDGDYELHLLTSRASNRPTCADVIGMIADEVAASRSSDERRLASRRGNSLASYCLLALHFRLASWPKFKGFVCRVELQKGENGSMVLREIETEKCARQRSPNRQIEVLIGALLATTIKRDTLTHLLGPGARRAYTKDSAQD